MGLAGEAPAGFWGGKRTGKQVQVLGIYDPALPGKLDAHVTQEGVSWGLWQWQGRLRFPKGFWSQVWKGTEERYSLIEKQLYATYHPLQATAYTWKFCCNGADYLSHHGVAARRVSHPEIGRSTDTGGEMECSAAETCPFSVSTEPGMADALGQSLLCQKEMLKRHSRESLLALHQWEQVWYQCHLKLGVLMPHAKDSPWSSMLRTGLSATGPGGDKPCGLMCV